MDVAAAAVKYFAATCIAFVCYQVPNTGIVIVEMPDYPDVVSDFSMPILREQFDGITYVYLPPSVPL
jgi:hypothetical protein